MRNVEIKARVDDMKSLATRAEHLAGKPAQTIRQDDTFFRCAAGRLKLRDFLNGMGELIFYRRPDLCGPKESFYVRSPTASPGSLREALTLAYGELGRVRKTRLLFLIGRTRVHLDDVASLGAFVELEVVLREQETLQTGIREAKELMERLEIGESQLIETAYIDLLMKVPTAAAS